jgi:uncharacterized protein YjbI with pentapeptide repeats
MLIATPSHREQFESSPALWNEFRRTDPQPIVFRDQEFIGSNFLGNDLTNLYFDNCNLEDCLFNNCKGLGVTCIHTKFVFCKFNNCLLNSSTWAGVLFNDIHAKGCSFSFSNFSDTIFDYFETEGISFDRCEFIKCNLCGLEVSQESLASCTLLETKLPSGLALSYNRRILRELIKRYFKR